MDSNTDSHNNSDNTNSNQQEDQGVQGQSPDTTPQDPSDNQDASVESQPDNPVVEKSPEATPNVEEKSDSPASSDNNDTEPNDSAEKASTEQNPEASNESDTPEVNTNSPTGNESAEPTPPAPQASIVQPDQSPAAADGQPSPVTASSQPASVTSAPAQPKKSKKLTAMILLVIFIIGLAAIGTGSYLYYKHKNDTPKPVTSFKVGLMMAFSGGSSAMGFGTSKGVALAKKQLNADNISVVEADSQCDPIAAVKAINSLIKQHVVAIIGDGCSSASLAALPIANNAQIPMISPSASSTKLSIPNDYFYRVIPNDNHQGDFMANTVYNDGIRKVAVFYTNEPYGASIEQAFQNSFESLGGKVVATAFSQPNVIDLSSQINTLKAANPQAIFFAPNSVLTGIAAVKLARQAGVKVPFYGADVFYDQTIISNAASDVEGMTFTTFPTGTTAFKQALANAYPNATQLYAAPEAYDAFKAIYLAIQKGATTGPEIKNTLPSIKFQGVSSYISFDSNGDLATGSGYQYALFQVKNGQFVQLN